MGTYRVVVTPAAVRDLTRLSREAQRRVRADVDALATNPRPPGVKKLSSGDYRIRLGPYRVVYEIQDKALLVLVLRIAHRREAYR